MPGRLAALGAALFLAAICWPGNSAQAQPTSGVGDDAIPLARHSARILIGGLWTYYDSRFAPAADGSIKKSGLYDAFSRASLGVADMPQLAAAERNIRTLSGLSAFSLSLGALEASGNVSKSIVPFQLGYGITNRLSIGVVVPYVETRSVNKLVLNRGGKGETVGQNPTRSTTGVAVANNALVAQQILTSRTALAAEIARCADPSLTDGGCPAIRANPAGAQALLDQSAAFRSQIIDLYGVTATGGSPLVPVQKSQAQVAIEAKLLALRASFVSFSTNSMDGTTLPAAATVIFGSGGLQAIAKDGDYGLAYDTLANGGRAGIGDVDLTATFVLLNTLGNSQATRLNLSRRILRSSITGGWRFGTATGGRSGNPFDLPTGDGANALLFRSTTDFVWNRKFWVSGTVRYAKPLQDNLVTRFPALNDTSLLAPSIALPSVRTLGARTEIEVAPRVSFGRSFGLSMAYAVGHQASSTLSVADPATVEQFPSDFGPPTYSTSAPTVQTLQFGATYSSLSNFTRGKARWPLEIVYSHGITVAGSGGVVPINTSDRIELRIYTRFPRR